MRDKHTVLYSKNGNFYKLCTIFFTDDGTYNVTSPYHPEKDATLFYSTVNYALNEEDVPFSKIRASLLKDDASRLKLAHHPDGFVHFSGQNIISGRDKDGNSKGVGVLSWPLSNPADGPSFAITLRDIEKFKTSEKMSSNSIVFFEENITPVPDANCIALEGFYFPKQARRFVQRDQDGKYFMQILHPQGIVISLKVILSQTTIKLPGIIGLHMYHISMKDGVEPLIFTLSGSSGNLRKNENGEIIGEAIFCVCPADYFPVSRSANYKAPDTASLDLSTNMTKTDTSTSQSET